MDKTTRYKKLLAVHSRNITRVNVFVESVIDG